MDKLNELNLEEMEKVSGGKINYEGYEIRQLRSHADPNHCPECISILRDTESALFKVCRKCKIIWNVDTV